MNIIGESIYYREAVELNKSSNNLEAVAGLKRQGYAERQLHTVIKVRLQMESFCSVLWESVSSVYSTGGYGDAVVMQRQPTVREESRAQSRKARW